VCTVTVASGGALYVNGGTIVGTVTAGTGAVVVISGASITGPLSFT
jgi:hypothetical protein